MTTNLDQMEKKVQELARRHAAATKKKSELKGRLEAKRQELAALSAEIRAAGVDPKKLKEARDKEQQDLQVMIESFEKDLAQVEAALAEFEQQK
jgi:septal ring factor EnvC (AmiA/AmiB activator)